MDNRANCELNLRKLMQCLGIIPKRADIEKAKRDKDNDKLLELDRKF